MSLEQQELAGNQSVPHKPVPLGSPHPSPGSDRAVVSQAEAARAVALSVGETNPPEPQVPRAPGLSPPSLHTAGERLQQQFLSPGSRKGIKSSTPRPQFHLELNISCHHYFFFPRPNVLKMTF